MVVSAPRTMGHLPVTTTHQLQHHLCGGAAHHLHLAARKVTMLLRHVEKFTAQVERDTWYHQT